MGMPRAISYLRRRNPARYVEACKKGGRKSAKVREKKRDEAETLIAIAAEQAAREEAELRESTNEHILSADGEVIE